MSGICVLFLVLVCRALRFLLKIFYKFFHNAIDLKPKLLYNETKAKGGFPMAKTVKQTPVKPNYVMRRSGWSVVRPWHILLSPLIVPLIIMIVKIINVKDDTISFYSNKVVHRRGIFNKYEKTTILTRVLSVTMKQTFWGRIFNYGTLEVDVIGKWDLSMKGIKNPKKAKAYLEQIAASGRMMRPVIMN